MRGEWREIQSRKARSTGATIQVTFEPAEDPSCRWQTTCETHGACVGHQTRALAVSFAAAPEEWCSECEAIHRSRRAS